MLSELWKSLQPSQKIELFGAEFLGLSCTPTYVGTLLRWFNTCWFAGWSLFFFFFFLQWALLQKGHFNRNFHFFSCTCLEAPAIWASWDYISLSPVPWQFRSSSPILQSSWPSQSHFSEMQRLLWHWNWSSAQRSSQPLCKQTQLKHTININDQSYAKINWNIRNSLYHISTEITYLTLETGVVETPTVTEGWEGFHDFAPEA